MGLPKHLAALLRHKETAANDDQTSGTAQEPQTADSRKARRRTALREKKKAALAESREKLNADRKAAKAKARAALAAAAEAEAKAAAAAEAKTKEDESESKQPAVKRKVGKLKRKSKAASAGGAGNALSNLFDQEGAERDEQLMQALEAKLGIAGDPAKRKRAERSIFADLGFDDDLLDGVEEPPSSDEQPPSDDEQLLSKGEAGSSSQTRRERVSGGAPAGNEHLSALLENILGSSGAAESPKKTGVKKMKRRRADA
mmetsp:Transcript_79610/g.234127  ORF Transcript_79610/g.234127 Transcript_79610/m.234127 type:complete len:258 (-) Transcript_79610:77-850(-)